MVEESVIRELLSITSHARVEMSPVSPTVASPSWWGADSERFLVETSDDGVTNTFFVKLMSPHTRSYVDWDASFSWATTAGAREVGPKVVASDPARGILVMEDLSSTASTSTVDGFDEAGDIEALVERRKAVRQFPETQPSRVVFDEIDRLRDLLVEHGGSVPTDFEWMVRRLKPAAERINAEGYDLVPCHGDGNVSNVMISRHDATLHLVDWDSAGVMDPLQDLGVLLAELRADDRSARPVFEMYWGRWNASLFDRCRIYGLADSVRWGLIGLFCDQVSPGTHEYSKFADWQFLRARVGLGDATYLERVLNL